MSASASIALLEALAALDESIASLTTTLAQSEGRLQKIAAERATLVVAHQVLETRQHDEEVKKRALEDEVRNLGRQSEQARDRQFRVHKLVDVQTVEREREELQRLSRDKRTEVEHQDALLTSLRAETEALNVREKALDKEISGDGERYASTAGEAQGARDGKIAERRAIETQLAPPLLRKYDQVRERRGTALAKAFGGRCNSCQMALPPTFFQKLRRDAIIDQCPSCQRLIYAANP